MKKIVLCGMITLAGYCSFGASTADARPFEKKPYNKNLNPILLKKPCSVSVTQPGTASGVDCYGIPYYIGTTGSCTKFSTESCEKAFIDANGCAASTLSTSISDINQYQQVTKCNPS